MVKTAVALGTVLICLVSISFAGIQNVESVPLLQSELEKSTQLYSETCAQNDNNQTDCQWFEDDYDQDGLKNGIDPCPSLSNISICDMGYNYVPTIILHNKEISVHPSENNFVYLANFENGNMFFFEAHTDVFFHDGATMHKSSVGYFIGGDPELDFTKSVFTTGSQCGSGSQFTPNGEQYICLHGTDWATKDVVDMGNFSITTLLKDEYSDSEIGYKNPLLRISSHNGIGRTNMLTHSHWETSYPNESSDFLSVEWGADNQSNSYYPIHGLSSMAISDSRDSILILDEVEQQISNQDPDPTLDYEVVIWNFIENTTYSLPLIGDESEIKFVLSVDVSTDGSIIMVTRTYEEYGSSKYSPRGWIQLFERDSDGDGTADRFDAYPYDPSKSAASSEESSFELTSDDYMFCGGIVILIGGAIAVLLSDEEDQDVEIGSRSSTPRGRNKPSRGRNEPSKNATCSLCGQRFRGTSEFGHLARNTSDVVIRTSLLTIFAGPIGFLIGVFGGDDAPYRPICPNCCGLCSKPKSKCICDNTYKHCSSCQAIVSYGEWKVNSGRCSGCHSDSFGDDL